MEKIRSGQVFLYKDGGLNSTVIEVKLVERVQESVLGRALNDALKRFPYFTSKFVEKDGDYYIADNDIKVFTPNHKNIRRLGGMGSGYHLIDVSYDGAYVRVAFHHAFCDGVGVKPFVETLMHRYFCLLKNKDFAAGGVWAVDSKPFDDETAEPFAEKYAVDPFTPPEVVKDGYALPECARQSPDNVRYQLEIDGDAFMKYAKSVNATPTVLLSYLFSKSIAANNGELDKPVVTKVAADMRNELGCPHTHKNCVRTLNLSFRADEMNIDTETVCTRMRGELTAQREPNFVKASANGLIDLSNKLDTMATLAEKQEFMAVFDNMTANTFVLSNLGSFDFGECDTMISAVRLYGSGIKGVTMNVTHHGGKFFVDVIMNIYGGRYVDTLIDFLVELHIPCVGDGGGLTQTPKDKTQKTARWQAERFGIKK